MQLTNISISAVKFNNMPFTRGLTATVMTTAESIVVPASGTSLISWVFPVNEGIYAVTPDGNPYISSRILPVSSIGTMYFYFSASKYNYKTSNYSLCSLTLQCINYQDFEVEPITTEYTQVYDTFPDIDLTLFVNYQTTNTDTQFFRLTSTSPFSGNIKLQSFAYTLSNSITSANHAAWFTLNNSTSRNYAFSGTQSFVRNVPTLSSVQAVLTASSAPGSFGAWWSNHSLERELQINFIPDYPIADFIGFPETYFPLPGKRDPLDFGTFLTLTPGLCFYGEGHTENILLSAKNVGPYTYYWRIVNEPFGVNANITPYLNSVGPVLAVASISSTIGSYPTLPVTLLVSNNYILTSSPIFYYDDSTGEKTYYPYYTSTVTPQGSENPNNTKFKESIKVASFDSVFNSTFDPGLSSIISLPVNGLDVEFTARTAVAINNPEGLSACYDRYGYIWKWSTFSECSAISGLGVAQPSSWATTQFALSTFDNFGNLITSQPGPFPKKWRSEPETFLGSLNIQVSPVQTILFSTTWYLSAFTAFKRWDDLPFRPSPPTNESSYTFTLQMSGTGGELATIPGFTVSRFDNTIGTLAVEHVVQSFINITDGLTANDWPTKETVIRYSHEFTSIPPYELYVYTPNKYVLTNTPIRFENLFIRTQDAVSAVDILLDDIGGNTITLTGENIQNNFVASYDTGGNKNIKITGYPIISAEKYTREFRNILQVIETYDTVQPESYYSFDKVLLELPWKIQPSVGSNDWVVSDNFNSCIKMFYDNLTYLDKRSSVYRDTFTEYYGWLGSEPTVIEGLTACPVWTWEDTDCTNPDNQYYVTWSELMSGGVIPEVTETGSLAYCGRWDQQECQLSAAVPNCLGKYCVEWRWSSRKSENSTALITWKDTKTGEKYQKEWRQPLQECDTVTNVGCDEGVWNVNLPGLNNYYDPIPDCYSQNRCSYKGIASFNNKLYTALDTQIKLLSSNRSATFYDLRTTFNEATPFVDIKSIAIDSQQKIYILDSTLSQVAVYIYNEAAAGERWKLFTTFGGVGGSMSKTKFLNPTNLYVDQFDNVWIADTGNFVLKQYTNTGSWLFTLRDDDYFKAENDPPLDVCTDSETNVHVLTNKVVRVYTYRGEFLFEYQPGGEVIPLSNLRKIAPSYNREMIYIANRSQVIRHFRTGGYSGTIINDKKCVDNINDIFQDEYRNLLIANDDKILKYIDLMTLIPLKSPLPGQYWPLKDLLIHDEEYVQNWVYTKALHRLWDNIEIFRNTLLYNSSGNCKKYKPPIHSKDKITIGQNEIVTSTVINRSLSYLWDNFKVILEYYDPNC